MRICKSLAACLAVLSVVPVAAISETYKESFECTFGRGVANRPTPTRMVFSIDELGRSALLHTVEIPKVDTMIGSGQIDRDSIRRLSISWSGREYTYSESGSSTSFNGAAGRSIDLRNVEFTVFLDRRTMKAIARSAALNVHLPKYGNAKGSCQAIPAPK